MQRFLRRFVGKRIVVLVTRSYSWCFTVFSVMVFYGVLQCLLLSVFLLFLVDWVTYSSTGYTLASRTGGAAGFRWFSLLFPLVSVGFRWFSLLFPLVSVGFRC